jgi:hypothetical protein
MVKCCFTLWSKNIWFGNCVSGFSGKIKSRKKTTENENKKCLTNKITTETTKEKYCINYKI